MERKEGLNKRINNVRKELKMSQKKFADKIGMSQRAISWSEQPGNNVPDSTIKSICTVFNISEDYLLYNQLPMFIEPDTFSLDKLIDQRNGTDEEKELMKEAMKFYFELPPDVRKILIEQFKSRFQPETKQNDLFEGVPSEVEAYKIYKSNKKKENDSKKNIK